MSAIAGIRMTNPAHPGGFVKSEIIEPLGLSVTAAAEALGVRARCWFESYRTCVVATSSTPTSSILISARANFAFVATEFLLITVCDPAFLCGTGLDKQSWVPAAGGFSKR